MRADSSHADELCLIFSPILTNQNKERRLVKQTDRKSSTFLK